MQSDHVLCWAGTVTQQIPATLGLRFPATDIPAQVRALSVLNTTPIIPDATSAPAELVCLTGLEVPLVVLSMTLPRKVDGTFSGQLRHRDVRAFTAWLVDRQDGLIAWDVGCR